MFGSKMRDFWVTHGEPTKYANEIKQLEGADSTQTDPVSGNFSTN